MFTGKMAATYLLHVESVPEMEKENHFESFLMLVAQRFIS